MSESALYPLLFEPSLHVKVWGGRQLETRLGKRLPTAEPYGESWEIFWQNRIANGAQRGKTLGQFIQEQPLALTGKAQAEAEFPLLVKFIDAQDWLSVQVHPDDALAQALEGEPRGKTECWYIVDAAPDAHIIYGFAQPTDAETFRRAIAEGRARDYLQFVPVQANDFIFVPAGTMHAIGTGILLYELQQTSDTTYRVYDWDRLGLDGKPRPLHLEKALRCTRFEVQPKAKRPYTLQPMADGVQGVQLIDSAYFRLERLALQPMAQWRFGEAGQARLITVIQGSLALESENSAEPLHVSLGDSIFVPARLPFSLKALGAQTAEVLIAAEAR
ncbi:MAG: mannose-6-phosphate isomerase [Candidatus Thermofonsia Clade 1 bacterium]|jgi:mannose-6-phosphate isomerase|uniref:Mannose-6-phosphate isomerase n=1 Tax=Candidatus Thermofonsia Clade 1 bacterium TaxID=2364210 RepID=A0A2M8PZ26_9CHLR|nr:MAG: mannose-6-phosphate isomerase [Candidatus Thermofonsia Clade 1 bacterium]PJF42811.1 MAG: mannose-6-phosphate isomerase [Candidatus Thermofonsia Clade 1 bacterium]RMF48910.1 MAG: mannose-6-phosphate isomerase [Chloroflexota bacterium]